MFKPFYLDFIMILSMTGYGKGSAESNGLQIEVEVRSVNSRFLDIYFRLPSSFMSMEYELREIIKKKLNRGKISVTVQIKGSSGDIDLPIVDPVRVKHYLNLVKQLRKISGSKEKIKLEHLLSIREVFSNSDSEFEEEEFNLIKSALAKALDDLIVMKKNEGKELENDLLKRIKIIEEKIGLIEVEINDSVIDYFNKLKEKAKQLVQDISSYTDRLELELALLSEKADITEECVRLKSHLKFFIESLQTGTEPGRKLNFLCQEMNREANTISSKSVSTSITHNSVLIKEEIEKVREQIQNVE